MEGLKKYSHLVAFNISAIIIVFSFTYILALQNNNTFYLKNLEGDSSVLSDLVITGYLQDKYHGHKLQIEKGNLTHKFKYYEHSNNMKMPAVKYGNGAADDKYSYWYNYSYEIAHNANTKVQYTENKVLQPQSGRNTAEIEVTEKITTTWADKIDVYMDVNKNWLLGEKNKKGFPDKNRLRFKTGVSIERDGMDFVFENRNTIYPGGGSSQQGTLFKSRDLVQLSSSFALATLAGKQYLTVIEQGNSISYESLDKKNNKCGNKYTGENGIFRAVEYVDYLSVFWGEGNGKAEKLVSFNHKEENFQMLGLHAVEDYLVAVMLVDNILTFRAYNPQNGVLLAELAVPEFKTAEAASDFIRYTPYVNGNTLSLHIIMQNLLSYPDSMLVKPDYISIVSVKISNGSGADINDDGEGGTGASGGIDADDGDTNTYDSFNASADGHTDADGSVDGCVNIDSDFNCSNSHSDSSKSATKNLKINLLHCIDAYNLENCAINNISAIVPVNGKLVVFAVLNSKQTNTASEEGENSEPIGGTSSAGTPPTKIITALNEFLYPVRLNLLVFDGVENSSRLLYSGEIVTDADDDNNTYRYTYKDFYTNDVEDQSGLIYSGYNYYENRNIGLVTVRGVKSND